MNQSIDSSTANLDWSPRFRLPTVDPLASMGAGRYSELLVLQQIALYKRISKLWYMRFVQGLNTMRTRTTGDPASTATTQQHCASCCPMPNTSPTSQMMRNVSRPTYTSMVVSTSAANGIGRIKPTQQVMRSWPKTDIAEQRSGVPMATLLTKICDSLVKRNLL